MPPTSDTPTPIVTRTRQDLINSTGYAFETPPSISANSMTQDAGESALRNSSASVSMNFPPPPPPPTHQVQRGKSTRRLNECCYSISNLLLIGAAIVGLVVLVAFIQDDPLYEYGEHVLSLAFYRQLIFIIILLPLVLLIPIANALQSFLCSAQSGSHEDKQQNSSSLETLLRLKLAYLLLIFILTFLALIFVAPYIRSGPLANSIELEIQKHMRFRYENNFSFQFLDAIQEEYQCCDQLWYRANMNDYLPSSCFVPGSHFGLTWDITCPWALAYLVSHRCALLAACLMLVLIGLACLMAIDLMDLLAASQTRRLYKVSRQTGSGQLISGSGSFKRRREDENAHDTPTPPMNGSNNRLDSGERLRDVPLLRQVPPGQSFLGPEVDTAKPEVARPEPEEPILLTRANYQLVRRERSQSPVFKERLDDNDEDSDEYSDERPPSRGSDTGSAGSKLPIKSALKKTPSSTNLDSDGDSLEDYADRLRQSTGNYLSGGGGGGGGSGGAQKSAYLQREQPTRRSLLSVRFAE